jgi:hypothetical protein
LIDDMVPQLGVRGREEVNVQHFSDEHDYPSSAR